MVVKESMFVVAEDGTVTIPREVLAAALAEPGDLVECWVTEPAQISLKVVFIPEETKAEIAALGQPTPPVDRPATANGRAEPPILTVWDMLARAPCQEPATDGSTGRADSERAPRADRTLAADAAQESEAAKDAVGG